MKNIFYTMNSTAKNYIRTLEFMVRGNELTSIKFLETLCNGLRPSTAAVLKKLQLDC